jgi:hypothetical protein
MKSSAFALLLILTTLVHGGEVARTEQPIEFKVSELLPKQWSIKQIRFNATPYNLGRKPVQRPGVEFTLVGPTVVKGPRGINDEPESYMIWVMPADYVPTKPETIAQFEEAQILGSNDSIAVYWATFTSGTPSWKTWKADVVKHFALKKAIKSVEPTRAPEGARGSP